MVVFNICIFYRITGFLVALREPQEFSDIPLKSVIGNFGFSSLLGSAWGLDKQIIHDNTSTLLLKSFILRIRLHSEQSKRRIHFSLFFFILYWTNAQDILLTSSRSSFYLFESSTATYIDCPIPFRDHPYSGLRPCPLDSFQDFLIKLDMKLCIHLVEISIF